jgi:hypothetical protein
MGYTEHLRGLILRPYSPQIEHKSNFFIWVLPSVGIVIVTPYLHKPA